MTRFTLQLVALFCLLGFFPTWIGAQSVQDSSQICNEKSGLAWEMNTEADMDHYTVYHSPNSSISQGRADVETMQVPHDEQNATTNPDGTKTVTHRLTLTTEGQRYFRVSAVDTSGNESPLSNEVGCVLNMTPGTPNLHLRFDLNAATPTPSQ